MPRICGGIPIQFAGTRKTTPRIRGGHPEEEGSLDAPDFRGLMKGRRQRVGPYFFYLRHRLYRPERRTDLGLQG